MANKQLKIASLLTSVGLVSLFIAFRSGYFNKKIYYVNSNKIVKNTADSFPKIFKLDTVELIQKKTKELIKIIPVPMQKVEMEEIFNFINFNRNNNASPDTFEIVIPDSMFLVDESFFVKNNKIISKDSFEFFLHNFLEAKVRLEPQFFSSSKSARVISPSEKILHLKNYTFKYNKLIEYKTAKSFKFYEKDLFISPTIKKDSLFIERNERMLSSKSGYIIRKEDLKKDTSNIIKKDSIKPVFRGSKSAPIFEKKDIPKLTKPPKTIEIPNPLNRY